MILHADPGAAAPTQAQIDAYARDGYLPWGTILEPDELRALRSEYDRVFAEARASDAYRNLSVADDAGRERKRAHGEQMLQIVNVCERSLAFRRLLYDERVLAVVRGLIGPNLMLFHDQALFKPPRNGGAVHWHQDNAYWNCRPANLVSCWLTLDDADVDNGAMQVIPGSHLRPERHDSARSGALLDVPAVDAASAVVVPLPAGACLFHHCQTLHYTAPNTTDRQRRAFIMHFMVLGTADRNGVVMRPSFARPVVSMA